MALEPELAISGLPEGAASSCEPLQAERLRKVPLFSALSSGALDQLCNLVVSREFTAPCRLFETGDKGDAMYLIEEGSVRISVTDADGHEVTLSELHEGDFFGELALIDGQERSAGATVLEDTRLAILKREDFISFVMSNDQAMLGMLKEMARRLRRTDNVLRHRVARNPNVEHAAHTTGADRAADLIARFGGSWKFIITFSVLLSCWIMVNTLLFLNRGFDPYPFLLLSTALNMLAAFQAPIIMMSQNRQSSKDRLRADLDYEVNLKNELLLTEIRNRLYEDQRTARATPRDAR